MSRVAGFPDLGRCRVMGVVNVTPDSFSDGGEHATTEAAVAHGLRLLAQGADIVDVGGESTRPGADRVSSEVEAARVLPVISGLVAAGAVVSVDTTRAEVASAALAAGAAMINDVSGGSADPAMGSVAARAGCAYVVMHSRGSSSSMTTLDDYGGDVVSGVRAELSDRVSQALAAGVLQAQLVVDPGLGFAKHGRQNWELLRALPTLGVHQRPLLVGASRKSFLGTLLAGPDGTSRPVGDREDATQAVTVLAAAAGAWCVRVHDVLRAADGVRAVAAWCEAGA